MKSRAYARTVITPAEFSSKEPLMKRVLVALAMMAVVGTVTAADKANFSGQWKINTSKSDYGPLPFPDSFTRKVEHVEPSITIIEEQTGPGTTPTTTRKMKTDGQPVIEQMNGGDVKLSAAWEGSSLIATTAIESFGVSFKDRMSLSDDGKSLTSVVQVDSPQGSVELKIVFDRE
jgi:hypothetical protein